MRAPLTLAILTALSAPAMGVEIDGRIDPAEWQGAREITDFRKVQPLSREPATLQTQVWVMATPEGLAVAFRNKQPVETRTRQKVQRDFEAQVDRVNLMIDYDGDGRTGYNFTVSSTDGIADSVISNETQFNDDWDGNWQHAVSEDDTRLVGGDADSLVHRTDAQGQRRHAHGQAVPRPRDRFHR